MQSSFNPSHTNESKRWNRLRVVTSRIEAKIDEKVFDLYDLTPDEREIVKGGGR